MTEPVTILTVQTDVGTTPVLGIEGLVLFAAGMAIDADGAPNAYHPPTKEHPQSGRPPGLDHFGNAWDLVNDVVHYFGVVTENPRDPTSPPIEQGPNDPSPGFYVSTTALGDLTKLNTDPRRYVDATKIPYISLPGRVFHGVVELGDLAMVFYRNRASPAIYADVGPTNRIGEGSIALAQALGLYRGNVDDGHDPHDVVYVLFPGSRSQPRWPRKLDEILRVTEWLFKEWGGMDKLRTLFPFLSGPQ